MLRNPPAADDPLHIHLFKNDYHPNRVSLVLDFDECTFAGYLPKDLNRADWGVPVSVGGVALIFYGTAPLSWLASAGSQVVYGYYVTTTDDSVCLWAERFDPIWTVTTTTPVPVTPFMRLHSELEPVPP
jgi:hypothetical protein